MLSQSTNYYGQVSTYYDEDAVNFDERYWENAVLQRIRLSFREEVKRYDAQNMLEIGCGTGFDLLHFGRTHPGRNITGIDISMQMIQISNQKIKEAGCTNVRAYQGSVEEIAALLPDIKFDMIYVFFGALNTVKDLKIAAGHLQEILSPRGVMVLSFVNKWYLMGMLMELIRFRFKRAFARFKPIWGGYSPVKYLPSKCYSPRQVKRAFAASTLIKQRGYSIIQPAWYFTGINQKLGKLGGVLWKVDQWLNKTFLWRFGEYSLFVFKN